MRKIGCNEQAIAKLEDGTPLPEASSPHPLYRAFAVDQPDGTEIRAYCENAAGVSDVVPIVLPEPDPLLIWCIVAVVQCLCLAMAARRRRRSSKRSSRGTGRPTNGGSEVPENGA